MARQRLTHEQAMIRGSAAKNPKRFASRKLSPKSGGIIGEAPSHLLDDQRDIWNEIALLIPDGVAGKADRITLEIAALLTWELRNDPVSMSAARMGLLASQLGKLGMDPQARTKMQTPGKDDAKDEEDEWSFVN
jgi:phage terminase small subunit